MSFLVAVVLLIQEETIDQLIEKLRSDKIEERELATQQLMKSGVNHIATLEAAKADKDIEVANRVKHILDLLYPEHELREITKNIQNARTVSITFSGKGTEGTRGHIDAIRSVGTILLKGKNRVAMNTRIFTAREGWREFVLVSDGSRMRAEFIHPSDRKWEETVEAPKAISDEIGSMLPLRGASGCLLREGFLRLPEELTEKGRFFVSNYRWALTQSRVERGEDSGSRSYSFEPVISGVASEAKDWRHSVTLWVEPKSNLLQKRTITWVRTNPEGDEEGGTFTESFDEVVLNRDISDEKFKLPEEKK